MPSRSYRHREVFRHPTTGAFNDVDEWGVTIENGGMHGDFTSETWGLIVGFSDIYIYIYYLKYFLVHITRLITHDFW